MSPQIFPRDLVFDMGEAHPKGKKLSNRGRLVRATPPEGGEGPPPLPPLPVGSIGSDRSSRSVGSVGSVRPKAFNSLALAGRGVWAKGPQRATKCKFCTFYALSAFGAQKAKMLFCAQKLTFPVLARNPPPLT